MSRKMHMTLQAVTVAFVLGTVNLSCAGGGEYAGKALVRSDSVAVHHEPTKRSKVVRSLRRGESVTVELEMETSDGSWCGIVEEGGTVLLGYVSCRYLERKPASKKWQLIGTTGETRRTESEQKARKISLPEKTKRPVSDVTVKLYMTNWCPYCQKAREYLRSLGVKLIEYDIEKDNGAREEMRAKGGNGVPLIDIEGTILRGYSEESTKMAIERRRSL